MSRGKVILSDIGNVVVSYDNDRTVDALAPFSELSPEEISRVLFNKPEGGLAWDYCRGDMDTPTFRRMAMERVGCIGKCSDDEFDLAFRRIFTPNEDVVGLWKELREKGVVITAVSDVEELRYWELCDEGIMDLFDHEVLSYVEKEVKPSSHMIRKALELSGCVPEDAVFVDDVALHLPPAEALGVRTYHYGDFDGLREFLSENGIG